MGVHSEWLLLDDGSSLDVIKDAYILPGSCVTVAQVLGDEVVYLDVYRTSPYRPFKYTQLANQTLQQFTQLPDRPNRNNFEGISLLGAAVVSHVILTLKELPVLIIKYKHSAVRYNISIRSST